MSLFNFKKFRKSEKPKKPERKVKSKTGSTLKRASGVLKDDVKSAKTKTFAKKKYIVILALIVLLGVFAMVFATNSELRNKVVEQMESIANKFGISFLSETDTYSADDELIGEKAIISSAVITETKTGTGPWDDNDNPGNDSSEDNAIVRSFDQVTWTVTLTFALKNGETETSLSGEKVEIEISLDDDLAGLVEWDLSSMPWLEVVENDSTTLKGTYTIGTDTEGQSQSIQLQLQFVLQVYGAKNETEILPIFKFGLEGNNEDEKVSVEGKTKKLENGEGDETIIVSATGKYNVELKSNTSNLSTTTTVTLNGENTSGRMYGFGFTVQLYNDLSTDDEISDSSKGLKGIEYPDGDITFEIDLQLLKSDFENSTDLTDITEYCTPILWNYRVNDWTGTDKTGNIPDREMYYEYSTYEMYASNLPLGVLDEKYEDTSSNETSDYCVYRSGDITIEQIGSTLYVTISNYEFNGTFPTYASDYSGSNVRDNIYGDNIGTFSVGYMQIFVPYNEYSTDEDMNYYLTISDSNLEIGGETVEEQKDTTDDAITIDHVLYKSGEYNHYASLRNGLEGNEYVGSTMMSGDGKVVPGQEVRGYFKFAMSTTNDSDIYSASKFIKFDGECFEPIYFDDGTKYQTLHNAGGATFNVWYVTKEDGSNWTDQEDMNDGDISKMRLYEKIGDIPDGYICIGIYVETVNGERRIFSQIYRREQHNINTSSSKRRCRDRKNLWNNTKDMVLDRIIR